MNSYTNKAQEDNNQAVANELSQLHKNGEPFSQLIKSAPPPAAPSNLQTMANNSPQVQQLKAVQAMASNSHKARGERQPIQKKAAGSGLPDGLTLSNHPGESIQLKAFAPSGVKGPDPGQVEGWHGSSQKNADLPDTHSKYTPVHHGPQKETDPDAAAAGAVQMKPESITGFKLSSNTGAISGAKVIQRMVIPKGVSGGEADVDTDLEDFHVQIAGWSKQQLLKVIVYMENHRDHNGFDVVYVYHKMWELVGKDPRDINPIVQYLNTRIPRPLPLMPAEGREAAQSGEGKMKENRSVPGGMSSSAASPLSSFGGSPRPGPESQASLPSPRDHVIDIGGMQPPRAEGLPQIDLAPASDQRPSPASPHVAIDMSGAAPPPTPAHVGLPSAPPQDDRVPEPPDVVIHMDGEHAPPSAIGPAPIGSRSGPPPPDDPEPGAQAVPPGRLNRVARKGLGGTTVGDVANSLGVASTASSLLTKDSNVSGGLGITGGSGVLLGGVSQVYNSISGTDTVKGLTNVVSGAMGIASGAAAIGGASEYAASVLGRISGGAWGVAEAINFIQKANSIRNDPSNPREYLHALNSLLKISAGVLIATSAAEGILIAASVLGGLGAASSVITGLHKLYTIYKGGGDPERDDAVDLEAQH